MPGLVAANIAATDAASTIVIFFNTDFSSIDQVCFLFARPKWMRAAQCHRRRALRLLARCFGARFGLAGFAGDPAVPPGGPAAISVPKFWAKRSWERAR
jgi:hypothetical protein